MALWVKARPTPDSFGGLPVAVLKKLVAIFLGFIPRSKDVASGCAESGEGMGVGAGRALSLGSLNSPACSGLRAAAHKGLNQAGGTGSLEECRGFSKLVQAMS